MRIFRNIADTRFPVTTIIVASGFMFGHAGPMVGQDVNDFIAIGGPSIALTNVKVIDGTGGPAREGQTILIENGRIAAVGSSEEIAGSVRNARVLDLQGHTVIPGLIGLHDHSFYTGGNGRAAQLSFSGSRLYLASGVTTIRTTGARAPYEELNLKRDIDAGLKIGPNMFTTGPYLTGEKVRHK